ncbi:MFS transporter [Rhodococcus sp. 114MFTsu3.1]|uniref:MFS transporter n=1 Tax=Rhodococcus sp. 114MFTsu3.1 TaxID=1172184 RepID=UPI0003A6F5DB|nr:MFS transporter [Rhodococcus sp. 114MFTsu3.1]
MTVPSEVSARNHLELTSEKRFKSLFASGVGNTLEWYDWTAYAVFSPFIAQALFDKSDPVSAMLATLVVFAVGFVSRPLGGMFFGYLAARAGRRTVLIATMLTMAAASLLIAVTPAYGAIGGLASALLLFARLVQGFAHGGESTASYAYVAEIAPARRRGLWSSTVYISVGLGTVLATAMGAVLTATVPAESVESWGWRVPFFVGGLLALFALYLRRGMIESDVYETQEKDTPDDARWSRKQLFLSGLKLFVFTGGTSVVFYTFNSFASAFAISQHGMQSSGAFRASLLAQLVGIVVLPMWGALSDKIGRKPVLIFWAVSFTALIFPLLGLIDSRPWTLFTAQAVALAVAGAATSIYAATIAEQLPTNQRTKVIGIAMSLSVAVFGGTAPYLNTALNSMGLGWLFQIYFVLLCVASLVVVISFKETRAIDLRKVGS